MSIASRIADGEFQENTRISGRSTLSSEYQVSPETVRKALNLLADMDIVRTVEGSGTIVLSKPYAVYSGYQYYTKTTAVVYNSSGVEVERPSRTSSTVTY